MNDPRNAAAVSGCRKVFDPAALMAQVDRQRRSLSRALVRAEEAGDQSKAKRIRSLLRNEASA